MDSGQIYYQSNQYNQSIKTVVNTTASPSALRYYLLIRIFWKISLLILEILQNIDKILYQQGFGKSNTLRLTKVLQDSVGLSNLTKRAVVLRTPFLTDGVAATLCWHCMTWTNGIKLHLTQPSKLLRKQDFKWYHAFTLEIKHVLGRNMFSFWHSEAKLSCLNLCVKNESRRSYW